MNKKKNGNNVSNHFLTLAMYTDLFNSSNKVILLILTYYQTYLTLLYLIFNMLLFID